MNNMLRDMKLDLANAKLLLREKVHEKKGYFIGKEEQRKESDEKRICSTI
jgi:hypothetical protein